ncbi:MAG: hypothetical protein AW10_04117 [Candidatus Accumulibacter appositus]|uniref:Uncharacterized protein n=1 Tax=Candidatus Accumulibacter appositus TaxID=1454003 RepID=A0A011PIY9_9PROT|nr:MAG: hypothetical protein AW10_04117 [Candidatus Accumulibacter appositus]
MHDDHFQELGRRFLEHAGDADFVLALDLAALHAGQLAIGSEGVCGELQAAIEKHLGRRIGVAQEAVLERQRVVVQGSIAAYRVCARISGAQHRFERALGNRRAHLLLQIVRVARQIAQGQHAQQTSASTLCSQASMSCNSS